MIQSRGETLKNNRILQGYIFAIISAAIYGCMPMMAKYIYADGVNPMTLVFLRNILSLPALAILAYAQNRSLQVPKKALPSLSLIAVMGCCVTPVLLFSSYEYIASGTATVFHFIYPAAVVICGILFLRRNTHIGNVISVIICIAGVSLFYTPGTAPDPKGSLLALSSGLTYAAYILLLSGFKYKKIAGFLFSFYVTAISTVIILILCVVTGQLSFPASVTGWILCILFSLAITTGAQVLFQQSTFHIGGERTSILSTLEPMISIIIGVIVFHEPMGPRIFSGSALVIFASFLIALSDLRKKQARPTKTE